MADKTSNEPTITKSDLEDPNLGKLNSEITWLKRKIGEMQGAAGEFFFRKPFKADKIRLRDTEIPETDEEVLSLGAAKKLFGAASVRRALSARDENGTIIRGLPRDAFDAAVPPGPITSIAMDPVDYTDPTKARLTGTATVPELFRGFNGCEVHIVIDPLGTPSEPIAVGHQYHDPEDTAGPYAFEMKPPRPSADETWRVFFASRNEEIAAALVVAAGPGQTPYADVSITANPSATPDNLGYPTIGTILEEGMLAPGDIPYVRLTIPYTAPSSGEFIGFTVWWSTDDVSYSEEAFEVHLGGADGLGGTVYRNWPKPASNETWYIVLSPHSETFGHQLRVGPGDINKGSVLVEAAGPPAADGITDAVVVSVSYLTELDDYGNPTFACEVQWTNPSNDSNFFHSELTVQLVDSGGTGEPTTLLGDERVAGGNSGPGNVITEHHGPWGPVGLATYDRFRLRLYCVNRLGVRTLQTIAWGGNSAYDIVTSTQIGWPTIDSLVQQGVLKWDLPYVSVTFNWTAPSSGSITAMTVFRSIDGADYEAIANLDVPNGADGLSYSKDLWLETPVSAAETWEFVMSPHTSWDGHRLWFAPGNINYDSIVVQPVGPPADFGASAAASVTDVDINLAELDAYGWPTFAVEVSWTHPTADSNFFHSKLTVQLVDAAGNPAPGMLGDERRAGGDAGPGLTITQHFGPWGPAGHPTYNRFRLRLYFVSRLADETLQATAWGGAAYYDINTSGAAGGLGGGLTKDATTFRLKAASTDTTNAIHNPGFEDGLTHWTIQSGTITIDTGEFYSGSQSAKLTHGSTDSQMYANPIRVAPGQKLYVGAYVKATAGTVRVFVQWYTEALASISFTAVGSSTSGSWTKIETTGEAPATASWAYVIVDTADAPGTAYIDNVFCRPQVPGSQIQDDAIDAGLLWTAEKNIKLATSNLSNAIVHNPEFEDGIDGWVKISDGDATIEHETGIYYSTAGSLKINKRTTGTYEGCGLIHLVACRPGDKFYIEAWVRSSVGASGTIKIQVNYLDASKSGIGAGATSNLSATTTWTKLSLAFTATNAAYLQVLLLTTITTGNWYVDSVRLRQVIETDAEMADGVLANLAKFGTDLRPIKIVSTNPSLPDSLYPVGQAIINTTDGKLYRNKANVWTKAVDELDVSAVYATAVLAGLFDGHSLKLNLNGITLEARNLYDSILADYAGLSVKLNSTGERTAIAAALVDCAYSAGTGRSVVYAHSGGGQVLTQYANSSKQVMLEATSSSQGVYINNNQVVGPGISGWSAPTGGSARGTIVAETASLYEVALALTALIVDLRTHGLIKT